MDPLIIPDKDIRHTPPSVRHNDDGKMDLGSQQANDGPHARVEARRVPLSEHLESTTGVSSTAEFVEESRTRETIPARSKSTVAPSGASGHLRPAARRGDTIKPDAKAEAQNQAAQSHLLQPLTGADNPRSRAAHAITVSESYSTPLLLDERNLPTIPISPQNVLIARTSRKAGGDGSLSLPEAHEASRSPHAQEDPHREVHATFRVEDRGHSFQSLSGSSPVPSSPLPPGTSSVSSLPSSVPLAAIKRTSSGIRSNKDIPPGELSGRPESIPKSTAYSDTNRGIASAERSHVKRLPDAVPDRVVTAESTSLHQHPSSPRIDRSTSHFQPPIQHHAVSSESSASETASPHHPSLTGVIRRTVSSYPRHRSDDDASRAGGASISDTDRTDGSPSPPTMALSSPRYQPSNKTLADPSASAERSIPHDSLVRKRWDMTDGPSDEKTRKEVSHNSSSTQGRRTSPATETTERHGSNIRDPPSPSRSLAVRQGQGDSTAKRGPSSSTRISKEESQTNMESRTRIKSPPDRIEHNHPSSSQSPSAGQPLSHTDSATYSDIPTRSRTEPSHSESTRPEGAEGGGQTGDGGQPGGTEALRPPPAKARSSPPEKSSKKALEASNARSLLPTLLDSPAIKHREMPASSTASDRSHRTTRKEDGDSSTLVRLISPAAEPTEGQGVNARDPSRPPLQSSVVRQGESDPVSKRGPSSSMGISREMSQAITDSRPRIESPLDRVENSLPSSSSSLSKLPPTHTPNSTAHSTIPKIRTEPSRLESLGPDGAGDGGNARDGGQQGSGVPTTTAEALPPTKALPPPPEQPSIETDTNALPPTLLGPPLNKPLMSSSRKEAEDGSLGMQDRRLQPILPAVPAQGHGVSLGEPLSLPPPQSSGVRQGTGDPVAKKEPSSSMGIAREKSQTPMESRTRTKSPQDRIVHTHSLSSSSLSRKPSTRPAPSTTADSSIPTSRSEPSHLESMRPEDVGGSGRSGGGEKQRGPNPRETTEAFPPLPTKTLSSPPEQPSSKNSADPSASTERSSHQHSSAQPQTDRSTSRFQQPNQHDTVSPESFACATATPIPSSLPGGVIRRTGSSHPRHGSENDVSRAGGASVPDTARSLGGLPPPPSKALSSPRDQPSNKNLVDRSAGVEKPYLSAPHDTLANKKGETMDSASDGITLKEVSHSSSTTQGRSLKPTSPAVEPTERHGDNLRDSPPPSHSLSVRQGQGDPAAKRGPSPSTIAKKIAIHHPRKVRPDKLTHKLTVLHTRISQQEAGMSPVIRSQRGQRAQGMVDKLETVDGKPDARLLPVQEKSRGQRESELVAAYWLRFID
ncbi:hypothetical protein BGW80DRAFT_1461023 [Lactifluus volemus]|nr:hypothetical protein BGW80DRAFT_1461023 [Lactifluus volemus]